VEDQQRPQHDEAQDERRQQAVRRPEADQETAGAGGARAGAGAGADVQQGVES